MQHPMTTRARAAVLGLVVGLLVIVVCVIGTNGPLLASPHRRAVTEVAAGIHRGDTVSIGSMVGCLNKPGSITIEKVDAVHAIGLRVTGWGLRPNPFWEFRSSPAPSDVGRQLRIEKTPLRRLGFFAPHVLVQPCGKHGAGYELAVQVEKTTRGEAGASGWAVTYTTEGKTKTFVFPIAVRLCNEKVAWAKQCRALKV